MNLWLTQWPGIRYTVKNHIASYYDWHVYILASNNLIDFSISMEWTSLNFWIISSALKINFYMWKNWSWMAAFMNWQHHAQSHTYLLTLIFMSWLHKLLKREAPVVILIHSFWLFSFEDWSWFPVLIWKRVKNGEALASLVAPSPTSLMWWHKIHAQWLLD